MKYTYTAYFSMSEDGKECQVDIPALDMTIPITHEKLTPKLAQKIAEEELGIELYMRELDGEDIPKDRTDTTLPYDFARELAIDTEEVKSRIKSITRFDIE